MDNEDNKMFEIITPYTYEEYKRLNKFHMRSKRKGAFVFLIVCVLIIFLAAIGLIYLKDYFTGIIYLIIAIAASIFLVKAPDIATARIKRSDSIIDNLVNDVSFYDKYFELVNEQSIGKVYYNQLFNAYETDTNYYLYVNKMSVHIISKNGFKLGKEKDFTKFLQSKLKNKYIIKCK